MRNKSVCMSALVVVAAWSLLSPVVTSAAEIDDAADLPTQQMQEKNELHDMRREMNSIRSNMQDALQQMQHVGADVQARRQMKEIQLQCKEAAWELCPGRNVSALTYNNKMPGPDIRVQEGDRVQITVQNQMKISTSLYFHGMILPQSVSGLPRKGAGLIGPGESYTFEFVASNPGTYWYHPQVTHAEQMSRGLYGAMIVEPRSVPKTWERDYVLLLGQWNVGDKNATRVDATGKPVVGKSYPLFLANGKSAPAIPPLEVKRGERVRLRVVNASWQSCPLTMTGHRFEVVAINGSESTEPHTVRDTVTVNPGERMDLEFTADNPGVWSLSSMVPAQSSDNGVFPGGLAIVVRYPDDVGNPLR